MRKDTLVVFLIAGVYGLVCLVYGTLSRSPMLVFAGIGLLAIVVYDALMIYRKR